MSSLLGYIRGLLGSWRRQLPKGTVEGQAGTWREPPVRGAEALLEAVQNVPEIRRVSHKVADAFGRVDFHGVDSKGERLEAGPLAQLLKAPNRVLSGAMMRAAEILWGDLLGEYFVLISKVDGAIQLTPIPPTWVSIESERAKPYVITISGKEHSFSTDECVHIKRHVNLGAPYGRGRGLAHVLVDEIETIEYASRHTKAYFYNNGTPVTVFSLKSARDAKDLESAKKSYEERHRGFLKAYIPAFLAGDWNVQQLGSTYEETQILELRKDLAALIQTTWGVPPEIIGQLESSNRATIDAAQSIFADHCIDPRADWYVQEFNAKIAPILVALRVMLPGERLAFTSTAPKDREFQLKVMQARPQAFTVNEWRELASLGARHGGDVYLREVETWEEVQAKDIIDIQTLRDFKAARGSAFAHLDDDDVIPFPIYQDAQ